MLEKILVVLIDDQQLIRESWKLMLTSDQRFNIVAQYNDPQDAQPLSDGVVLYNINTAPIEGQWAAVNLVRHLPDMRVIVVSEHNEIHYIRQLLDARIAGFITKTSTFDELMNAIVQVNDGNVYVSEDVRASVEIDLY